MSVNKIRVVGLGMACLDIIIRTGQLPSWEKGVRLSEIAIEGGGPSATAIVASQRLGIPSGFIGTYGNDRLGEIKKQTLAENGVDVSQMVQREYPENQVVLVAVQDGTGERIFSGINKKNPDLRLKEIDSEYITQAEILHLDGYHAQAALQAAKLMKRAGKKVMLDGSATSGPVSTEMKNLLAEVDILISGHGFGEATTGETDLWKSGRILRSLGPDVVVQTEGKGGSFTICPDGEFHIPAFEIEIVDTTGAGDVFHGAFLVGMLHKWDIRTNLIFCTAAAGIKCTQISGRRGIPTFDEVIKFLSERGVKLT